MKHTNFNIKIYLIIAFLVVLSIGCNNTDIAKHKVFYSKFQSVLDRELSDNNPGISVSISSPLKNIYWSGAAGYSDRDKKIRLHPDQTFRIASVTKTFVAATILRLWEDKRLSLDDPITMYISERHFEILKKGGYSPDKITIRHLLTHSGGLSEHTQSEKYRIDFMKTLHVWTRTEQINDLITYSKPFGSVGENFKYSDSGYVLLGEIIEKITGKSMGDAISEQLKIKKLGMKDTYMEEFNGDFTGKRIHQYYEGVDTYNFHPSLDYYGGGGLLSTTADLNRFYLSLFQHKIFHYKATLDTMLTPVIYKTKQPMDYRMGIWQTEVNGMKAYTHSGFWGTQVMFIPEINTAISANYSQRWSGQKNAPVISKILHSYIQMDL